MEAPGAADRVFQSVLAIDAAETFQTIQTEVRSLVAPFGYDRFVLFSASAAREEPIERIYWIEGDWFGNGDPVTEETYIRRCAITRHILGAREPFFWTKTFRENGELYRVVNLPRGPGIHGLQVPVFGPWGLEGAMSLGGTQINASPTTKWILTLLAVAAFYSARKLIEAPVASAIAVLSDREREVLTWTAAGRRQFEIAATLGLSERTIENHLRRIRHRLGVSTTAQAIRIAIRNGEITI